MNRRSLLSNILGGSIYSRSIGNAFLHNQSISINESITEFNIVDYGAKGDGIFDNSNIINSIISKMPLNGGTIVIPHGDFLINSPIQLKQNFITIRGLNYGMRSTVDVQVNKISFPGGGSKLILGETSKGLYIPSLNPTPNGKTNRISGITIKDLLITSTQYPNDKVGIFINHDNDGLRIDNVCCINLFKSIYIKAADAAHISNCWLAECIHCLHMEDGQQCIIDGCHLGAQPQGITCYLQNQDHLLFTGNVLFPDGYSGLVFTNAKFCSITSNIISGFYTGLIELHGYNNTILNNNINALRANENGKFIWKKDPKNRDDKWGLIRIAGDDNQFSSSKVFSEQPKDDSRVHCVSGFRNYFSQLSITGNASWRKLIVNGTNSQDTKVIYCGLNSEIDHPGPNKTIVIAIPDN